jgi:hypothetical protein
MGPMNGLNAFRGKTRATASAPMMAQSVANIIRDHVKLSMEASTVPARSPSHDSAAAQKLARSHHRARSHYLPHNHTCFPVTPPSIPRCPRFWTKCKSNSASAMIKPTLPRENLVPSDQFP